MLERGGAIPNFLYISLMPAFPCSLFWYAASARLAAFREAFRAFVRRAMSISRTSSALPIFERPWIFRVVAVFLSSTRVGIVRA